LNAPCWRTITAARSASAEAMEPWCGAGMTPERWACSRRALGVLAPRGACASGCLLAARRSPLVREPLHGTGWRTGFGNDPGIGHPGVREPSPGARWRTVRAVANGARGVGGLGGVAGAGRAG
jgi:hypothetical protein